MPALEVVAHRTLWSLLFVLLLIALLRRGAALRAAMAQPRLVAASALSALLLALNWLAYVWAVQNDHVLDASLGYFINPLVNVALGMAVLHEGLRRPQVLAIHLAVAGVVWLSPSVHLP